MINALKEKIKGKGTRIVFTEGSDPRILEAAVRLHKEKVVEPVLLGNRAEIIGSAQAEGFDIEGIEMLDPAEYKNMNMMVKRVVELRKGKMDEAAAREACLKTNFFGTMYVELGCADGLLGGATYSTADTVRPALQLVKTRPGNSIVSSCFIMMKEGEETTKSGIILASAAKEKPQIAEVIEVGPGEKVDGKIEEMNVKKGDSIIVSKYSGTEVKYEGEEYLIVKQDDILAIVE